MKITILILMLLFLPHAISAENPSCEASASIPNGWSNTSQNGIKSFLPPDKSAILIIECSMLPKVLTDKEFSANIREEEPQEAPPLKQFGAFRGRTWIINDKHVEWWLMDKRYMIHITLKGLKDNLSKDLKNQVDEIVKSLVVKQP